MSKEKQEEQTVSSPPERDNPPDTWNEFEQWLRRRLSGYPQERIDREVALHKVDFERRKELEPVVEARRELLRKALEGKTPVQQRRLLDEVNRRP